MIQNSIIEKYGLPGKDYNDKYLINWNVKDYYPWFPVPSFYVNKAFRDKLFSAFANLEQNNCHTQIKTFDGCFVVRDVRGSDNISLHSWGMAIDLNASLEPLGATTTNFSGQFIAIMKAQGIYWGGDWIHRKDPMHFALYNG